MPITLTESAAKEIRSIIKDQGLPEDATRLRVGVKGGGCSGFSYMLDLDEDAPAESDEQLESNGVKILCDMKSYLYLNGAEIDFIERSEQCLSRLSLDHALRDALPQPCHRDTLLGTACARSGFFSRGRCLTGV